MQSDSQWMEKSRVAPKSKVDTVANLAKRRGLVYPCGEIYGGTKSAWDYGPLGVELKENIKRQWWRSMVTSREDVVGLDSSVILPRQVWQASGHVETFTDPLVESLITHKRYRADHLLEAYEEKHGHPPVNGLADIRDPETGDPGQWTEPRNFSGLLKTFLGPVDDEEGLHYLRPETAQGIFVNYKNVETTARKKPPFGIAQIGKASATRSRRATSSSAPASSSRWRWSSSSSRARTSSGTSTGSTPAWPGTPNLGIDPENLRLYEHPKDKLSHYSTRTVDIEYRFRFQGSEWGELEGVANRTDFDLKTHSEHSGTELSYYDQATNERYIPYVIEPAAGLTRSLMAFLVDAYAEDEAPNAKGGVDVRTVLRLDRRLAPVKAAVLPLSRNADLTPKAKDLAAQLRKHWNVEFDDAGAIGRRYRRQDEIGTPFCITVDFDTLDDQAVTIRERDSMAQERIALDKVEGYLAQHLIGV